MPALRTYTPLPLACADTARREMAMRLDLRKHAFVYRKEVVGGAVRYSIEPAKKLTAKATAMRDVPIWLELASAEDHTDYLTRRAKAGIARERREDDEDDGRGVGIGIG